MSSFTEAEAAAIRRMFEEHAEPSAMTRARGRIFGIAHNVRARACVRAIARWAPHSWFRVILQVYVHAWLAHGRLPNLLRPRRYMDKVQWRKLFELEPVFAILSDKMAARDFIAACIGAGRQAPLLWAGNDPDAIPFDQLMPPYVLKSSHASGHTIIVPEGEAVDRDAIRATARGWLAHCHGTAMCEPAYINVPRLIMVERCITATDGTPPVEPRVFVFDGRAEVIQTTVHGADGHLRTASFHSRDWRQLPIRLVSRPDPIPPPRPPRLAEMIEIAERLGADLSHCRVDFFDCGDRLVVGEVTLYCWSGMTPFHDPAQDLALGARWTIRRPGWRALRAVALGRWEIRPPQAFRVPGEGADPNACIRPAG